MRKKSNVLTALMIGSSISLLSNISTTLAYSNNESKQTTTLLQKLVSYYPQRYSSEVTLENPINPETGERYINFIDTGFQPFYYKKDGELRFANGFITSYTDSTFTVRTNFFKIDKQLYHSSSSGNSSMGLTKIDGKLYYFNENISDPYAHKGLVDIGNNKYYFNENYQAETGFYTDKETNKRYYFDENNDGKAFKGWSPDHSMYFDNKGVMSEGITKIDGDYYLFLKTDNTAFSNAYKKTGFYTDPATNKRYYFDLAQNGKAFKGWHTDGTMYFNDEGIMSEGVTKIDDDYYLFLKENDNPYSEAFKSYGWYTDKSTDKTYYFDKNNDGKALKGVHIIDGETYNFSYEGVLQQ